MDSDMTKVWEFVAQRCAEHGIDDSHGLIHSKATVMWAKLLLDSFEDVSAEERKFALYGAALHDMCDSKYMDVSAGQAQIRSWLLDSAGGWSVEDADALIGVIGTTSYSKLKKACVVGEDGKVVIVYPEHGKWQRAYHIIRHADLLDAYIVERCMLYNEHIYPTMSAEESWARVIRIFDDRVFKYVSDGWLFYPAALALVPELEAAARDDIRLRVRRPR